MNVAELIQTYFDAPSTERLGREVGLSAADAERVLRAGLPLQLGALADHARTPGGQADIGEALGSLPAFASVEDALSGPEGASQLGQAGALLAPALLGGRAESLTGQVTGNLDRGSVQRLLHLSLPLLLSFLGQRGLTTGNVGSFLSDFGQSPGSAADIGEAGVITATAGGSAPAGTSVETTNADTGPLTPGGLISFLKGEFGGATADRLGRAAGFSSGTAGRATLAALPLVLHAIAGKASTGEGAADLLKRSREFERLTDAGGGLNTALLTDAAETARIEGQGRGLIGSLFPNVDRVTGRLGSAIGGSGANAGRLLALLTPLVLGLLVRRAQADKLDAPALSRLLGGMGGGLAAMLPAGMTGLAALLAPVTTETGAATPTGTVTKASPAPIPTSPMAPPPPTPTVTPTTERRRGFPRWILPLLLLLLLGGCWLLQNRQGTVPTSGTPATGATGNGIQVARPASGATVPADDFVMSGTGPANDTLRIEEGGQPVASVRVGPDGNWEAAIPAPTPGEHTYTISGQAGASTEAQVSVTGTDGAAPGGATDATAPSNGTDAAGNTAPGTTGAVAGDATGVTPAFAITEPAANAQLPAGGFTLRGTGTPGQTLQVFEDGTSLGNVTVAGDGAWTLEVPSPTAGAHTYSVQGPGGSQLGQVAAAVAAASPNASAAACNRDYTLSISDGQTVSQPFRFGGVGQGEGYSVTVRRGERVVGTKNVRLDSTCGWSYQSNPGPGRVTYQVRPLGESGAVPLSSVTLTVQK
ncbi:DUF937 domain-containing protein [Deinococcus apachensis]|uniref:DUF937 domain-containing protein n=1 Tax=Deinococcus apachensis TaxID=309886 RepID=UPI0003712027|nr:DUF937 domain-containing protein [Deinococcus apachensis]